MAAGKSAVGRLVARKLGYSLIDTGMMYRALTWLALEREIDPADERALVRLAQEVDMTLDPGPPGAPEATRIVVDGVDATDRLRTAEVGRAVSLVSRVPEVREAMVALQRKLAGRTVMVGRDIGTVVLPDAKVKVYLEASVDERARRRHEELRLAGREETVDEVRAELVLRDEIDSSRSRSPLRPAEDATVIQTEPLSLEEVAERILNLVPCSS